MKILIKVTKDVLKRAMFCGTDKESRNTGKVCAIAIAVREIFPLAHVGHHSISSLGPAAVRDIRLPDEATTFIALFDSLRNCPSSRLFMDELSFEIDVPQAVIDRIGIGQIFKILSESKTLEHVNP